MGMFGFMPHDASGIVDRLADIEGIRLKVLESLFKLRDTMSMVSRLQFLKVIEDFMRKGIRPAIIHMANSGAIIHILSPFTMVRTYKPLRSHATKTQDQLPTRQVMKLVRRLPLFAIRICTELWKNIRHFKGYKNRIHPCRIC